MPNNVNREFIDFASFAKFDPVRDDPRFRALIDDIRADLDRQRRALERDGFVNREQFLEIPPRVVYSEFLGQHLLRDRCHFAPELVEAARTHPEAVDDRPTPLAAHDLHHLDEGAVAA